MKFMKQFLIAVAIMLFSNNVLGQNLTLAQILEVKKKDLGNAEEYLTAKGWEFKKADEPTDETLGKVSFTYNKSNTSDLAESFLTYFYSNYSDKTRIDIQINKKAKYTEYINSIKSYGCKLIKSKVENGRIVKIYRGATTTFEVTSSTSSNFYNEDSAVWFIFIVSNEDYDLNWGDE
jgi:beta-lactam-binding protein with PASTA domain